MLAGATLTLPPMDPGRYRVTFLDTQVGIVVGEALQAFDGSPPVLALPPFRVDLAIAVRPE